MNGPAYYNEIDPYAAAWLRSLIAKGLIAAGDVDERSIEDVQPDDLNGYRQCHFFAGIGGWSLALRIAGWADDRPIWTGSPPCQDFSLAGHVWGVRHGIEGARGRLARPWLDLIERRSPSVVGFENVPGIKGQALTEIEGRLAGLGLTMAKSKRASRDIGAPHLRRREWRFAYRHGEGQQEPWEAGPLPTFCDPRGKSPGDVWSAAPRRAVGMDDGFPARVAAIRAFGNAIDPWVAAEEIKELMKELV